MWLVPAIYCRRHCDYLHRFSLLVAQNSEISLRVKLEVLDGEDSSLRVGGAPGLLRLLQHLLQRVHGLQIR